MKMTTLERDDDVTHIVLSGRLDTRGVEEIGQRFSEAATARERPAIVDLSGLEFMASRGIGLLVANGKKLMANGHKMVLLNPKDLVESVLKTCRLERVLPIAHDLSEAMGILLGVPDRSGAPSPPQGPPRDEPHRPVGPPATTVPAVRGGPLRLAIKNVLSELDGLTAAVREFLDARAVPDRAAYAVNLAIDELVVNVLRYAYVDSNEHFIDIELAIEDDHIILRMVDDGRPFDPRRGPSLDLHAEEREVGGLGLLLVLDMVDELNYRRVGEKNWVEARIRMVAEGKNLELSAAMDGPFDAGTN